MKRGKRRAARTLALGLSLALLASALGAGVSALGGTPAREIALAVEPDLPASQPLVTGDVLCLEVTAAADFAVYSNSTVVYYDKRYFSPCDADGNAFGTVIQGAGVEGYLKLDGDNPLCKAGPDVFGSVNVPTAENYAAITLAIPHDLENSPAAGVPTADMPWFSFCLKAEQATPESTAAAIFMPQDGLRTEGKRGAPMYYSAAPGGTGWLGVDVTLPEPLEFTIEEAALNPVRVDFEVPAGARGSLAGDIIYVRNIEAGTSLEEQVETRWPAVTADTGFYLAGWAYAHDPLEALSPETLLEADMVLVPVFSPRPVTVQPYLLDLSLGQEIDGLFVPLSLYVGDDYNSAVADALPALNGYPVDTAGGWFMDIFTKNYAVPETDDAALRVEIARVHRGTWYITYASEGGADVSGLPGRTEKPKDVPVQVAGGVRRKGFTFLRWTDGTVNYSPGQSYAENRDLALTAEWQKNPDPFVAGGTSLSLQYKSTATLQLTNGIHPVTWSSAAPGTVSVHLTSGLITGVKTGSALVTGTDGDGIKASVNVTVSYAWWQWLIIIFLFGWLWY